MTEPLRICLVYDCLFPWTIGGVEAWMGRLARELAGLGHDVTYLTLRQWDRALPPRVDGIRVVPVGPRMALYAGGRRRVLPPLLFGVGVLLHLLRHGRDYDVVHLSAFPYFPVLAASATSRWHGTPLVVDWWEVWTDAYWARYLGPALGKIGRLVQHAVAKVPQRSVCYSRLHRDRLRRLAPHRSPLLLRTVLPEIEPTLPIPSDPVVVFAGRLIPEKRAEAIVGAIAAARHSLPNLRAVVVGDGPERDRVRRAIDRAGLSDVIDLPGFLPESELDALRRSALCLLLPSSREGYGLVVLEAAAVGVPCVVVAGDDNAAAEWIAPGVNGVVAPSPTADDLASAILAVHAGGEHLRASTATWYQRLTNEATDHPPVAALVALYREAPRGSA